MDRAFVEAMHCRVNELLAQKLWHRIPLTGDNAEDAPPLELVAYLAVAKLREGETDVWFTATVPTRLTGARLARDLARLELPQQRLQRIDWTIVNGSGEMIAMPSQQQIEDSVVAVANAMVGECPIALYASLRCERSGARVTEFWHPQHVDSEVIFRVFRRHAIKVFG